MTRVVPLLSEGLPTEVTLVLRRERFAGFRAGQSRYPGADVVG